MNIALFILRRAAAALLLIAAGGAQAAIPATQAQALAITNLLLFCGGSCCVICIICG